MRGERPYHRPFGWWGGHGWWHPPEPLSLVELLQARTLDPLLAGLLWVALERKASLLVASGPPMAGKTTLLTALVDLLPPHYETVYTHGWREDFAFLAETDPARTYILVNEISDHLPVYLWGPAVARLFSALERGYSLGATMHAEDPRSAFAQLTEPPNGVPPERVARCLHLFLTMALDYGRREVRRRVAGGWAVGPGPAGEPTAHLLAEWDPEADALRHHRDRWPLLAERLGLPPHALEKEADRRARFLLALEERGIHRPEAVRSAVRAFYEGREDPPP